MSEARPALLPSALSARGERVAPLSSRPLTNSEHDFKDDGGRRLPALVRGPADVASAPAHMRRVSSPLRLCAMLTRVTREVTKTAHQYQLSLGIRRRCKLGLVPVKVFWSRWSPPARPISSDDVNDHASRTQACPLEGIWHALVGG